MCSGDDAIVGTLHEPQTDENAAMREKKRQRTEPQRLSDASDQTCASGPTAQTAAEGAAAGCETAAKTAQQDNQEPVSAPVHGVRHVDGTDAACTAAAQQPASSGAGSADRRTQSLRTFYGSTSSRNGRQTAVELRIQRFLQVRIATLVAEQTCGCAASATIAHSPMPLSMTALAGCHP